MKQLASILLLAGLPAPPPHPMAPLQLVPLRAVQESGAPELEGIEELHRAGEVLLASQPTREAVAALAELGATSVIDVRGPDEPRGYDEAEAVRRAQMRYVNAGFASELELHDGVFETVRLALHSAHGKLVVVHGETTDRAAAVWLAARVLDDGVAWKQGLTEARGYGLRSQSYADRAREYVLTAPRWQELKAQIRARHPLVEPIAVSELAALLSDTREHRAQVPLLLDVRSEAEYAVSHLRGALRSETLEEASKLLEDVPRERELVLYCSVGARSAALAEELHAAGFSNVRNLEGSIFEWANYGHALYRGEKPARKVHPFDAHWGQLLRRTLRAELEGQ